MTYFNGNPYRDEITLIYCDSCACSKGKIPFTTDDDGTRWQERPWHWAPKYGDKCHNCNKEC